MTQRLFQRLRPQMGSVAELGAAIADAAARRTLLEQCRHEVITQAYEGAAGGVPGTLARGGGSGGGGGARKHAQPDWRHGDPGGGDGNFFSTPASIQAGEREVAEAAGVDAGVIVSRRVRTAAGVVAASRGGAATAGRLRAASEGMPSGLTGSRVKAAPGSASLTHFLQVKLPPMGVIVAAVWPTV